MGFSCRYCKSENTGRSPSGDWCNECGWSYPGLLCDKCGRKEVDVKHKAPDGAPCRTGSKARRLG